MKRYEVVNLDDGGLIGDFATEAEAKEKLKKLPSNINAQVCSYHDGYELPVGYSIVSDNGFDVVATFDTENEAQAVLNRISKNIDDEDEKFSIVYTPE